MLSDTITERFWTKVLCDVESHCWLWQAVTVNGYGFLGRGRRGAGNIYAHRFSYELLVNPIPEGLEIDHLCRVRKCVNPDHLEAVSRRTNLLRGLTQPAKHLAKTHCPAGHPYDLFNTYWYRGSRRCKTCHRQQASKRSVGNHGETPAMDLR